MKKQVEKTCIYLLKDLTQDNDSQEKGKVIAIATSTDENLLYKYREQLINNKLGNLEDFVITKEVLDWSNGIRYGNYGIVEYQGLFYPKYIIKRVEDLKNKRLTSIKNTYESLKEFKDDSVNEEVEKIDIDKVMILLEKEFNKIQDEPIKIDIMK